MTQKCECGLNMSVGSNLFVDEDIYVEDDILEIVLFLVLGQVDFYPHLMDQPNSITL